MSEFDDDDVLPDYARAGIAKALLTARIEIYVRDVTKNLPPFGLDRNGSPDAYEFGEWFYVELHAREIIGWWGPLGIGVVQVDTRPYLHSVLVLGTVRRFGLGTRIVEAAGERWPNIYWDGCGASAEFHAKLVIKGIAATQAGRSDVYDFVPKDKRQAPLGSSE
jgi:GNAT superfamily N-acetyltransferase